MMKFLRNKTFQKRLYLALAIAILPPFLFWGVSVSGKGEKYSSALGVIAGHKVSLKDYLNSVHAVERQWAMRVEEKVQGTLPRNRLYGEAWDRILLLHYAKTKKIKVSDAEVVGWVTAQPLFQRQGVFDAEFYKRYVTHFRISTRTFEEEIRQALILGKVSEGLGSVEATENLLKALRSELKVNAELMKSLLTQDEPE